MTKTNKVLSILDLFETGRSAWSADDISKELGFTKPTGYRYVKELCDAGLLLRMPGGLYVLGPRIIELDYEIRQSDPMIVAGQPLMQELRAKTGCEVLLSSMINDKVLIIHAEELTPKLHNGTVSRGKLLPLFTGSTAKIILANLPKSHLSRIYEKHAQEIEEAGLGKDFKEFRAHMGKIRRQGYYIAHAELDPGITGLSVPIFEQKQIRGSLTLGMPTDRFALFDLKKLLELIDNTVKQLESLYHIEETTKEMEEAASML